MRGSGEKRHRNKFLCFKYSTFFGYFIAPPGTGVAHKVIMFSPPPAIDNKQKSFRLKNAFTAIFISFWFDVFSLL